ncbi:MAG: hypothetical protein HY646_01075 [Acidobacteria bacterium]|nr:hypothetical protein [Acidobacteriota bacterium]
MNLKRHLVIGAVFIALLITIGVDRGLLDQRAMAQGRGGGGVQAPILQVDPLWPKPLPNHWILGSVTGVAIDAEDNVWITHRGAPTLTPGTENGLGTPAPTAELCCAPAPNVLKFDPAGNLVAYWDGTMGNVPWPRAVSGLTIDSKGNLWVGGVSSGTIEGRTETQPQATEQRGGPPAGGRGAEAQRGAAGGQRGAAGAAGAAGRGGGGGRGGAAPTGPQDAHVLKLSSAGRLIRQIGAPGKVEGSESQATLNMPAGTAYDPATNEIYVSDGGSFRGLSAPAFTGGTSDNRPVVYGNRRVVVFDADTGAYKRHWGAYGNKPQDGPLPPYDPNAPPSQQFSGLSCIEISRDGLVYVCDRENNRIQVFQKDGKFVKEVVVSKDTRGEGAVWDIAFSADPQQRFMYVANAQDKKVHILNRETLQVLTSFGRGGRYPGQFSAVSNVAVDSKGNVYTGETYQGKRLQKFIYKGLGSAPSQR